MAGYVIHLAVAKKFYENNKDKIDNYEQFINGVIDADFLKHSSDFDTHDSSNYPTPLTSYKIGTLLHIATDKIFYSSFSWNEDIYSDYDKTNKHLIDMFKLDIPEKISLQVNYQTGLPKTFTIEEIQDFIEKTSKIDIFDLILR